MKRLVLLLTAMILASAATGAQARAAEDSVLAPYLLQPGDMSGFQPGSPQFFKTIEGITEPSGEGLSAAVARRYESEGFVEAALVRIHSRQHHAKGASSVVEFESPAAAKEEVKDKLKEDLEAVATGGGHTFEYFTSRHFKVSGVPGAVGFALLPNRHTTRLGIELGVSQVLLAEGDCVLSLGILSSTNPDVIDPVREGIQGTYGRTAGACP